WRSASGARVQEVRSAPVLAPPRARGSSLVLAYTSLRVELDDQLLADRQRDVLARRQLVDRAAEVFLVERDPLRHAAAIDRPQRLVDPRDLLRRLLDLHHVARAHEVRRDVDLLAV